MKALKVLLGATVLGMSMSAVADRTRAYECGTLKDIHGCEPRSFVTYSVHVDGGLVTLRTVHGGDKGFHSTTNVVMEHVLSTNDSEVYSAGGIRAEFKSKIVGRKVHNSLTIRDREWNFAECH